MTQLILEFNSEEAIGTRSLVVLMISCGYPKTNARSTIGGQNGTMILITSHTDWWLRRTVGVDPYTIP